ncbi:MAG: HAMP domain-containing sensor histidine kinase [Myxococcota bacterium]
MSDEQRAGRGRKRHRRRRRERERREEREEFGAPHDTELMTAEERLIHEAQDVAERKAKLTGDALKFSLVAILLLTFVWPIGVIVMLIFGPRYLRELYSLVVEPQLRTKFLREEIEKRVYDQLHEERQQLETEHARSMEKLSASIAHEIRNPITAAKSLVQQMEEDPDAHENVEYARVALSELTRVERSVSHLLRFARDEETQAAPLRLAEVVDSALATFRDRIERRGIILRHEVDAPGEIEGDAEQLRRVVINLVGNAVDALEDAEEAPRLEVQVGENLAGDRVWLRVADNGPGFDTDALEKLWSPFYTNKPNGTGLGLAITRKLVEAHGGEIEASSRAGDGAAFVITLPKHRAGIRHEGSLS